jgi:microcystin-dependent protein
MSDQFVAEIRIVPFNFAPTGWALCDGQLLPLSQNTALFALLGTTYGGDGKSTFALPNMQGNAPMHPGQGQGLSLRDLGEQSGSEFVTLLTSEMPLHTHAVRGSSNAADTGEAAGNSWGVAQNERGDVDGYQIASNTTMALTAFALAGGSLPHNNMMPDLTLNFIIALQGIFPARP